MSATRWLVSVFPATTAEGCRAFRKRALRSADVDRGEEAVVDGDVGAERHLHREDARRPRDGERRVHVRRNRRRGAVEVDLDPVAGDGDRDADRHVLVELDLARRLVPAVRETRDRLARAALGVGDDRVERLVEREAQLAPARRSASRFAAICAARSARRISGVRTFASRIALDLGVRRTGGRISPSCQIDVEAAGSEPGTIPPTSEWWARVQANASGGDRG